MSQPTVFIHNTASGNKEPFEPIAAPAVTMYNCGPTVYDHFHIGNARNFVVMDVIRHHLIYRGYQVTFVQNFTDIDDKIIKRAAELGEEWDHLARRFEVLYFQNAGRLGVRKADIHPRATDHIPQMLRLIETLIERGLAYATPDGDVYYSVRSFPEYGALSGRNLDDLLEGARVEPGETKRDPLDFALWKAAKPGEPFWETPWGKGRPGWHLECSAMSMHHLGPTIDIHSGGTDLVFPHHENECAQSCGATGKQFARYWIHNGFLTRNDEKMGKSLGNFFTIDDVLAHYEPGAVRLFLLSAHYRSPLEYSGEALDNAKAAVQRIREAMQTASKLLKFALPAAGPNEPAIGAPSAGGAEGAAALPEPLTAILRDFDHAMDDDFNSQQAIGQIFKAVALLNEQRQKPAGAAGGTGKSGEDGGAHPARQTALALAHLLDRLGLYGLIFAPGLYNSQQATGQKLADGPAGHAVHTGAGAAAAGGQEGPGQAPGQVPGQPSPLEEQLLELLIEVRAEARKAKQFAIGDKVRDRLTELGIRLQDHPTGTIWLKD